jgi:transposase-like protein
METSSGSANQIDFWKRAISEQEESGLTIAEYSQLIEKSCHQFYYWKRRIRQRQLSDTRFDSADQSSGFIEITAKTATASTPTPMEKRQIRTSSIEVRIGSFVLSYGESTDPGLFKSVAAALLELVG